jgi:hypothetical protein
MKSLSFDLMHKLNSQGFIPGPKENANQFFKRISSCKKISSFCLKDLNVQLIGSTLDFFPEWIEVQFSKKKLPFWQGAATWTYLLNEEVTDVFLQLHPVFKEKNTLFGIYKRDEIFLHEFVHVLRSAFDEQLFEELLAYQTSTFSLRKVLGPLFSKPLEVLIFFILLTIPYLSLFFLETAFLLLFLPLIFFLGLLTRSLMRLKIYKEALKNARKALVNPLQAENLLLRLKDQEIISLSKDTLFLKKLYASDFSLRVCFLKNLYTQAGKKLTS